MAYRGFTGRGDSINKNRYKTPVNGHEKREEQYTRKTTFFRDKDGKDVGIGHLNEKGEIVDGPLEIRVSDNLIAENGTDYTIDDYIKSQERACKERGRGYIYTKGIKGVSLNRMGIKGIVSKRAVSEKRAIVFINGYEEYPCGN